MLAADDFFDLTHWAHPELFGEDEPVWEALRRLKSYMAGVLRPNARGLARCGPLLTRTLILYQGEIISEGFDLIPGDATKGTFQVVLEGQAAQEATVLYAGASILGEDISLGPGCVVEPGALIKGPAIIGAHCEIRQGAYMRGHCLVGDRCVVGHTTEMKHAVMMDGAKAGHFAYIGDSVLGNSTNLGAGTKLANLKIVNTPIALKIRGESYDTGLRKFGAVIGDQTEIGCNAVTNPGTLLARRCLVCPGVSVKSGYYPERSVVR